MLWKDLIFAGHMGRDFEPNGNFGDDRQAMPRHSSVMAEARYRLRYDLAREPVLVSFVDLALPRRGSRLPYGGALTG